MVRVYGLLSLVGFAFLLYCLLDCVLTEASLVRNLPKPLWVVVIILVPVIGGTVWLIGGRPRRATYAPGGARSRTRRHPNHPAGTARPRPPMGPEDDPVFLRSLEDRLRAAGDGDDVVEGEDEDDPRAP